MLVTFEVLSGVRSTLFSFLQLKNIFSMLVQSEMSSPERLTSSKPEQLANMAEQVLRVLTIAPGVETVMVALAASHSM